MKTDNELIAEFMGIVFWKQIQGQKYYKVPKEHVYVNNANLGQFRYDKSWDWLMPVVEKIGRLYEDAFPKGDEFIKRILAHKDPIDKEYIDVISTSICTPISEVYEIVVTFIKWYNSQPK